MRVLARGDRLPGADRLSLATAGLALRGHAVYWLGEIPTGFEAAGVQPVHGLRSLSPTRAEVVLGPGGEPRPTAIAGWIAGSEAMVLDVRAEQALRWGLLDRFAWHSLSALALIEEAEAPALAAARGPLEHERIGLWPEASAPGAPDAAHPDTEVLERACERSLARHRRREPTGAVFVDRDGTLVRERGYLSDPEGLELLPGVARALRNLSEAGHPVVVISNQSGIERGYFTAGDAHAVMGRLRRQLRESGVELTAIYFCPHAPERHCPCRKPGTNLLERAADDLLLSLRDSVMIGDKRIDAETGQNAGGSGVLVRTGYGAAEEIRVDGLGRTPDRVFDDLSQAAGWWIARGE